MTIEFYNATLRKCFVFGLMMLLTFGHSLVSPTSILADNVVVQEKEPNDSPQTAQMIPTPAASGDTVTVTGDALSTDAGTLAQQLEQECALGGEPIQDWFAMDVTRVDSYQFDLSFPGMDIDYDLWLFVRTDDRANFPQGIKFFTGVLAGPGQEEITPSLVLAAGARMVIGISRVADERPQERIPWKLTIRRGGTRFDYQYEDVLCQPFLGPEQINNALVVNRITPVAYPARLQSITALFLAHPGQRSPAGQQAHIVALVDDDGDGNPNNSRLLADITAPIEQGNQFVTVTLANPPAIDRGDVYVGLQVENAKGIFADVGRGVFFEPPNQNRELSYISVNNGRTYTTAGLQNSSRVRFAWSVRATLGTAR